MENKINEIELNDEVNNVEITLKGLSIQELIDLSTDSQTNGSVAIDIRNELINRGKNNIETRIIVKKSCKKNILKFESLLNTFAGENNGKKEVIKTFKNKFLTSVSIMDKIQLEWQKHDLGLNH